MTVYLVYDIDEDGHRYVDSVFMRERDAEDRALVLHGTISQYEGIEVEG